MRADAAGRGLGKVYTQLLRLYMELSQQSPLLFVGLIVLLMASWGLIVGAITEITVHLFDIDDSAGRPSGRQ